MTRSFFAALVVAIAIVFSGAPSSAQNAYITNMGDNTVSVIATATNTAVGAPIPVGSNPFGVAVTSDGSKVYVTNGGDNTISVIATATNTVIATFSAGHNLVAVAVTPDGAKLYVTNCGFGSSSRSVLAIATATNTVITTIPVPTIGAGECPNGLAVSPDGSKVYVAATAGVNVNTGNVGNVLVIATATDAVIATIPILLPFGVAVTPDGSKVYVAQENFDGVSVIATATNTVIATIPMSFNSHPLGVAVTPDGSKVYVTNNTHQNVSVIATATNTVIGTIPVGLEPLGVAVTPDGSKVYVANSGDSNVSVIATATDTVVGSPIAVGNAPVAFGLFIQPSSIPFSIFAAQLTVYPVQAQFAINASFTLGATSNGINPPTEPVTLQIGGFTVTIPPRSFVPSGQPGYWTFVGVINGENLTVMIKQRTGNNYIFGIIAKNVQLSVTNPVTVTLTIGNDKGSTSVTPVIINTK